MTAVSTDPADKTYITVLSLVRYREASRVLLAGNRLVADVSSPRARWLAAVCTICGSTVGREASSEWFSNEAKERRRWRSLYHLRRL